MSNSLYPSLYQINTLVRLNSLSRQIGRPETLDDILDSELDELANQGFDWIYYTFRTSNFGNTRGGVGVFDKGFASMELA